MDKACAFILALSQQPGPVALAGLAAAALALLLGDTPWHPLFLWPLSIALAILAGGPPLCEMVLLRAALGTFATVILLVTRRARPHREWRLMLGSMAMRVLVGGLAAAIAVSFLNSTGLAIENPEAWRALAGAGALGAVSALVNRTPRGVAAGTIILLMAIEGALWLLRPSLVALAGSSIVALAVALAGALHQEVQADHAAEKGT